MEVLIKKFSVLFFILFLMLRLALLLGSVVLGVMADEYGSDDLLKAANQRITQEFMLTNPFWTTTMIPIAVSLAVVLLIISIFAVSLIAIRALNEPEPAFVTFAPPGFDALWERNVQAELGMNQLRKASLETIKEESEEEEAVEVNSGELVLNRIPSVVPNLKFPEIPQMKAKVKELNIPMEPPKPTLATNSKTGLDN